jgi:hypothetical protein
MARDSDVHGFRAAVFFLGPRVLVGTNEEKFGRRLRPLLFGRAFGCLGPLQLQLACLPGVSSIKKIFGGD